MIIIMVAVQAWPPMVIEYRLSLSRLQTWPPMVRLVLQMRFMSMAAQVDVVVQSRNGWKSEALGGGRWLSG